MRRNRAFARHRRAGYLTPALALAILTAFLVAALALNVGWQRAADREIVVAADAAALAAASQLACDERLLDGPLPQDVRDRIANKAEELASRHEIVGVPAFPMPRGVRIGQRIATEDGQSQLVETDYQPSTVAVSVWRGRDGRLPWLFRAGGHTAAMLTATAEASIYGKVTALRPRPGGTVPVWPLAVRLGGDPTESAEASAPATGWRDQIEMKLGPDRYSFDHATGQIVEQPDGLPELIVLTLPVGGEVDDVGLTLVDVGQTFGTVRLDVAMREGLSAEDLQLLGGEVPVTSLPSSPVVADALPQVPIEVERNLALGDARALFLYDDLTEGSGQFTARLVGVVAARLMELEPTDNGGWQATFQPAVLATGTAVLADVDDADVADNRYLYKVRLTR